MFCGAATYSTKRKVCQKKKKLSHRFLDFSSSPPLKAERILCKKKVVVVVERDTRRREKTIILYRPWVIESETRLTKRHPFSRRVSLSPEQKRHRMLCLTSRPVVPFRLPHFSPNSHGNISRPPPKTVYTSWNNNKTDRKKELLDSLFLFFFQSVSFYYSNLSVEV